MSSKVNRNPVVAALLSALIPGAGQMYAREYKRGITLFIGVPAQAAIFYGIGLPWLAASMGFVWLWNIWDALMAAKGKKVSAAIVILLILMLNIVASVKMTNASFFTFDAQQRSVIGQIVKDLFTPDVKAAKVWHFSETLKLCAPKMIETIYLALLGTLFSIICAIPLSFLGARNLMCHSPITRFIYMITRFVFGIIRSVEVLIIAILAAAVVGIGPFAGVIALSIHGIGALGKLYSEAIESIDHGPIEAIRSTGANDLQVVAYAVVPQVVPQFIAFTLYRWDINVRMATVIGLVGGGGIGSLLIEYTQLYQWQQAATAIWLITGAVLIMDYASAIIREKII